MSPSTELVFVKLGGSIITDKLRPSTTRRDTIRRLADEIVAAQDERPDLSLLLGHGSGSFGHTAGEKYRVREGISEGQSWWGYAQTGAAAARLNRIVVDIFLEAGVPVIGIQPSATARCRGGQLVYMEVYPIRQALCHSLVPMVHGDVAFDETQGCTIVSTENVMAYLARTLRPTRMVLVGQVDGVYDRDPLRDPKARQIPRITPDTFSQIEVQLGGSHGVDVTGGMLSKVHEMLSLVAQGDTGCVHLISGTREGALNRVLLEAGCKEGTVIER